MTMFVLTCDDEDGEKVFGVYDSEWASMKALDYYESIGYAEYGTLHIYRHTLNFTDLKE